MMAIMNDTKAMEWKCVKASLYRELEQRIQTLKAERDVLLHKLYQAYFQEYDLVAKTQHHHPRCEYLRLAHHVCDCGSLRFEEWLDSYPGNERI